MHTLSIKLYGPGQGEVFLDGKPILARSIEVRGGVDQMTFVSLEIPTDKLDVEVLHLVQAPSPPPPLPRGERGDT